MQYVCCVFFTGKRHRPRRDLLPLQRSIYHNTDQGSRLPTLALESPPLLMWLGRAQIWKRCHFHQEQTRVCTWLYPVHFSNGPARLLALSQAGREGQNTDCKVITSSWTNVHLRSTHTRSCFDSHYLTCVGRDRTVSQLLSWEEFKELSVQVKKKSSR